MTPDDLIDVARSLASGGGPGAAGQARWRRSISTAYYAVFHALARLCADALVDAEGSAEWVLVCRALDHAQSKNTLTALSREMDDPTLRIVAKRFSDLQLERQDADYHPTRTFTQTEAEAWLQIAVEAVRDVGGLTHDQRRVLAVRLHFRVRPVR